MKTRAKPTDIDSEIGARSRYLSGVGLYGDEFGPEAIAKWYEDEKEGYANLGAMDRAAYRYEYHALNRAHSYRFLRDGSVGKALGLGSAYGDEFKPIAERLSDITILDPSDAFSSVGEVAGVACRYVKPLVSGDMPFESNSFDLVTSFGVLHHIPNVTHVVREIHRCLRVGGLFLVREPIVSMGDWAKARYGLTKNERGIPLPMFDRIVSGAGFTVVRRSLCDFSPIPFLSSRVGIEPYNNSTLVAIDAVLSKLFSFNYRYHRTKSLHRLAPASVSYVLEKGGGDGMKHGVKAS